MAQAVQPHAQAHHGQQHQPIPIQEFRAGEKDDDRPAESNHRRQGGLIQHEMSKLTPASPGQQLL
jgi:hypothetical protein